MLGGNILILFLVVIVILSSVLKVLLGIFQGALGGKQIVADLLGGSQIRLQVHFLQLLAGDLGQPLKLDVPGLLRSDQHLKLCLVVGDIHLQCLLTADQGRAAGLCLTQCLGRNMAQLIAQLHFLDSAVQGSQLAV